MSHSFYKSLAVLLLCLVGSALAHGQGQHQATLTDKRTINEWCRHCPDWNKTRYSFRTDDGMTYVGETHKQLDIALNGHNVIRFAKDGHVGDNLFVQDDSGKEQKLKIVERIAPKS